MTRKLAGAATTLLLAALAAGCGGDKDSGAKGSATLTKAEFIERADAICSSAEARIDVAAAKLRAAGKKSGTLPRPAVVKFLRETSLPSYERMLIGLRELEPPKADERRIDAFLASLSGAIDAVEADPSKYAKRATADPFDDANKRAMDYGMKVCGS